MKKISVILLSLVLALGVFWLEGGSPTSLLVGSAIVPLLLGTVFSTLFSYSMLEIRNTFQDAFSPRTDLDRIPIYKMDIQIVNSLESTLLFWSLTIVTLAIIGILSSLTEVSRLGPQCAMAMVSLLLGFGLRAILLTPMKNSIARKLVLAGENTYPN